MANAYPIRIVTLTLWVTCFWLLAAVGTGADIYKYQKDGVWYYSDTPPPEPTGGDITVIKNSGPASAVAGQDGAQLLADFPSRTPVEKATAATVAVKTSLGFGSGFFITQNGHIVTNKHVVRTTEIQAGQAKAQFDEAESRLRSYEISLAQESQRIDNFKKRLDRLHSTARSETNPARKEAYQADYEKNRQTYRNWRQDYEKKYQAFSIQKERLEDARQSYEYDKSLADLSRRFIIILADKSEYTAHLLAVSNTHDLALLKLDGYRTPRLERAALVHLVQGDPVFAIGSPARLQNSVTSGIFSGFQQGFLQTNAQIYPGNSGGPLVNEAGLVLGINTFKQITHKFEGLGFAIPISTALAEFEHFLSAP